MQQQNAQALWKRELYRHANPFNPQNSAYVPKCECSSRETHMPSAQDNAARAHTYITLIIISQLDSQWTESGVV